MPIILASIRNYETHLYKRKKVDHEGTDISQPDTHDITNARMIR